MSALRPFRGRIASAVMILRAEIDHTRPNTSGCDVVVTLHPSGEVSAGAQQAGMEDAIDRATDTVRDAVEHAVSQPRTVSVASPVEGSVIEHGAIEIVLDGNRISQYQREILERPENYMRPVIVREYSFEDARLAAAPQGIQHRGAA